MAEHVFGNMEAFDPERGGDWPMYTERMEQYFVANGIDNDAKKKAVFLTVIGGKAYGLLRNLLSPTKPADADYATLIKTMKDHLSPKPLVIAERFKFHKRDQHEGESVSQYLAALRKLAEKCDFNDFLDQALRDKLVCGLRNESIQRKLLAEADLTLKRAVEVSQGMEAAHHQASELQAAKTPQDIHPVNVLKRPCFRCGKTNHAQEECYFRSQTCHKCGKVGHVAKVCRGKKNQRVTLEKNTNYMQEENDPDLGLFTIKTINCVHTDAIKLDIKLNGAPVCMELDTGASVSLVSERVWREKLKAVQLEPPSLRLRTYTGEPLKLLGQTHVQVAYENQSASLPLLVASGDGPSLFGRNWLNSI